MAEWVTAGKVRMTPRGTYSSSATYAVLDLVRSIDGSKYYIAKKPVPAGTALTNTEYFEAIVDVSSAIENASDAVYYIAPTETSPATAAHAVGKFIIYDGNLYKVTSQIASGDTLTVGTNIAEVTIGDEVADLKNAIGNLDDLHTDEKNDIVGAINEVNDRFPDGIEAAVDDWLDAHPEATTTVEDFSLTANKLVKGTLGYVIPQQFGAKGDGVTDDSLAMKECITFARENNYAVFLPQGTYIVRHGQMAQTIRDGQSIIIIGSGQNSIVKRMDDSLPEYQGSTVWAQIFTIINAPQSAPAHDVIFANFCIDSNRRNQSNATSGYTHEASMDISIRNGSIGQGQYLDRFIIENMRFYDPVADCVNVSGTAQNKINHVIINKMIATDRHGTRNDIGFTACPIGETIITNCMCGSIHFEFNYGVPDDELTYFDINNCVFNHVSLASRIHLVMHDCLIKQSWIMEGLQTAKISGCVATFASGGSYWRNVGYESHTFVATVYNSTFISKMNNDLATYIDMRTGLDVDFINCRFVYDGELNVDADGDSVNDHVAGYPVFRSHGSTGLLTMDNCYVDKVFEQYVRPYAASATIKNCVINTLYGVNISTVDGSGSDKVITFTNVKLGETCKSALRLYSLNKPVTFNGEVECTLDNFDLYVVPGASDPRDSIVKRCLGNFRRICKVDVPITFDNIKDYFFKNSYNQYYYLTLFKDDVFEYVGADSATYPNRWRVLKKNRLPTKTGSTAENDDGIPLTQNLHAEGNSFGPVINRPLCILSPGFMYFDTTLNIPVIWDGARWVNADGSPALGYTIAEGNAARVLTDVETNPIDEFRITFAPRQSGAGDPSPENIRPITGWTGCNLYQTGENLITTTPLRKIQGATISAKQIISNNYYSMFVYPVPKGTLYATKESSREFWYGTSDNSELVKNDYVEQELYYRYGTQTTIDNEHGYLYASGTLNATDANRSSLSYGEASATMLEPGTGETFAIVFGDGNTAYYGGYVDVLTSTLYVTHGYIASYAGETLPGRWISDRDVYAEDAVPTTGAEVAYELAEPTTVSLTSIEFELMSGVNTLWADTNGGIKVAYWHH